MQRYVGEPAIHDKLVVFTDPGITCPATSTSNPRLCCSPVATEKNTPFAGSEVNTFFFLMSNTATVERTLPSIAWNLNPPSYDFPRSGLNTLPSKLREPVVCGANDSV